MERGASPWFMGPMSTRQRILYFLMMHNQDTYGQLVVYLRLNGITPPASRQPESRTGKHLRSMLSRARQQVVI